MNFYLSKRFFIILLIIIFGFVFSFFWPILYKPFQTGLSLFIIIILADIFLLISIKDISADRILNDKLSNGDVNKIYLILNNHSSFFVKIEIVDEIPIQFQIRDILFKTHLKSQETIKLNYNLRPLERGEFVFNDLLLYVASSIGLIQKKWVIPLEKKIAVYPSFMQMRQYEIAAFKQDNYQHGIKKIRKLGQSKEFEQIKEYVNGDDIRHINWQATARRSNLMVNQYQDEVSQNIYMLIDKSRNMYMPFNGLSLLDYAINSALVMANIAIKKYDKAGLITFNSNIDQTVMADRQLKQIQKIMDALYTQTTKFEESDFEKLYIHLSRTIAQRSMLILFTNFQGLSSMQRQAAYLRAIAKKHLLVLVFFQNSELNNLSKKVTKKIETVYEKTIAEQFMFEKKLIVKELQKMNIHAILSSPEELTINTINKYLELKAKGLI
jgi:uncharacterized protein (DUF58 family)